MIGMPWETFNRISQALRKNKVSSSGPEQAMPGAHSALAVGRLINGRYRLDSELGRGGMGIVYRAWDLPKQRDVAIKVINLDRANELTLQQFLQEAKITLRLKHPHIVAVYEADAVRLDNERSMPYMVMEFVDGRSLADMHDLTYRRILEIGKQICEALDYAHAQGLIYRDLKPGNVLVEKRGFQYFARLTDFGLAHSKDAAQSAPESSAAGTLFYLAPELIAGQFADIRSDLYALGATLYEMIAGRVPFSDFEEQAILVQHLKAPVPPPSQSRADVPPDLEQIVLRLLAKNPQDRFASAREVYEALDHIVASEENNDRMGNLPEPPTAWIGQEDDVLHIIQLLEKNRLVTVLGSSTGLNLEVGRRLVDQFADGVWWVNLDKVDDPALVLQTVVAALGVIPEQQRSLTVSLIEHLREKNLLLLIGPCEHLLGACAQLAETILKNCSDVCVLMASQMPLNISAEKCYLASQSY